MGKYHIIWNDVEQNVHLDEGISGECLDFGPVTKCFGASGGPKCVKLSESIVLYVVQFIPGPFCKSLNGAPPAAKNSPKKAQISLSQIVLEPVVAQNV